MESNNDNYGEGVQQLRKRKFNELANDGQPTAAEGEGEQQHQPLENLSKKKFEQQGNDAMKNLHLESLAREELIQLVQKQLANQNDAHKQLEAVKNKAEENAKQQAKEMTTKVEELNKALLASQKKVEQLTAEMAKLHMEHHKHSDSAKQTEEFAQRIVQLEQEKAEVHAELGKKVAEIVEKSEELAEKAKQIDALLIQLNQSAREQHQIVMPTEQQMKIQLSLETWYDWLAFVPRHQLGKILPQIGDRKFGSIVQKFLHEYGEITIGCNEIVAPYEEDPSGHPRVRAWQIYRFLRFEMAEAHMPANIKSFYKLELSYFDHSVLEFLRKFQHNGLLNNVNLWLDKLPSKDIVQTVLRHLLPLINSIVAIGLSENAQLADIYNAENGNKIYEINMKMMAETRILGASYDSKNLHPNTIDLYCRWLYQTARADGKPRTLLIGRRDVDYSPISLFINRIKKDFLMATYPVSFFIRIDLPKAFKPQEDICLDNGKTKERLMTKMEETNLEKWETFVLLITRHPLASTKKCILGKEFTEKTICLSEELKVIPI